MAVGPTPPSAAGRSLDPMRFTLVHSPLVGPTTWSLVATRLRSLGHEVAVPSLVDVAARGRWQQVVEAAAAGACEGSGTHVVVVHSGAGPLLPMIAKRISPAPAALVFVDAGVPPASGTADLVPPAFFDHLLGLAVDGRLPRWSDWFGDDVMADLVQDPIVRSAAAAELPQLPLSYFAEAVPVPKGWTRMPCAYLLLSDPYGADLAAAAERGWPVAVEAGKHLDLLNRPEAITASILELVAAAVPATT